MSKTMTNPQGYKVINPTISPGFQTQCCAGETPAGPLPMSLTLGVPTACQVGSAVVLLKKENHDKIYGFGPRYVLGVHQAQNPSKKDSARKKGMAKV
jgi:hypothetical protein